MRTITATELARNLRRILDSVEFRGEEVTVVRNKQAIARILPGVPRMTALEAMSDLYRTLPEPAAAGWLEDSRAPYARGARKRRGRGSLGELRDRWDI